MLINVIPTSNSIHSAVVFSVVFDDLEPDLTSPQSWTSLLQFLRRDELELPKSMHALDKSAGIVCLLEDVTFDLSTMAISCQFVDGSSEQWPLPGGGCVSALQKILRDVNESSRDIERQQERENEREQEREREWRFSELGSPPPGKTTRHKKQRSLLMTIVACVTSVSRRSASVSYGTDDDRSIIPLYTSSRLPSPPPTPFNPTIPHPSISPRARRRKARSELVDAFRRYALSELSHRFPRGGYYAWIIQSMLRRATEAVENILRHNKEWTSQPHPMTHYYPEDSDYFSITAASLPPTPSVSDDEGEEADTDTDGSSLHTPSSSQFNLSTLRAPPPQTLQPSVRKHHHHHHHSVAAPAHRFLYPGDQAEYTLKVSLIHHLRRLLSIENARQAQLDDELQHHHDVLEIRSCRRGYLNKALLSGVPAKLEFQLALAQPTTSSPLARHSWSGEDYECEYAPPGEPAAAVSCETIDYDDYDRFELRLQRTKSSRRGGTTAVAAAPPVVPRLFPVSEKNDRDEPEAEAETDDLDHDLDDDVQDLGLALGGFEIDLESGLKCESIVAGGVGVGVGVGDGDGAVVVGEDEKNGIRVALEVERPQHRSRMRTSSIRTSVELPLRPRRHSSRPPLSLPLPDLEVETETENPPVYTEVDVNPGGVGVASYGGVSRGGGLGDVDSEGGFGGEFTLAMDLPLSVRVRDRDIFGMGRKGVCADVERGLGWGEV